MMIFHILEWLIGNLTNHKDLEEKLIMMDHFLRIVYIKMAKKMDLLEQLILMENI